MPLYLDLFFITDAYKLACACSCCVYGYRRDMYVLTLLSYRQSRMLLDSSWGMRFYHQLIFPCSFHASFRLRYLFAYSINNWLCKCWMYRQHLCNFCYILSGSPHFFKIKELTWHADNRMEGINNWLKSSVVWE